MSYDRFESVKRSAEQGLACSMCELGGMYLEGKGTKIDYNEALRWFTKASELGVRKAETCKGVKYAMF